MTIYGSKTDGMHVLSQSHCSSMNFQTKFSLFLESQIFSVRQNKCCPKNNRVFFARIAMQTVKNRPVCKHKVDDLKITRLCNFQKTQIILNVGHYFAGSRAFLWSTTLHRGHLKTAFKLIFVDIFLGF